MKFSTLTVVFTAFLQTAVKASGQDANTNTTINGNNTVNADEVQQPAADMADLITLDFMFPIVPGVSSTLEKTMDEMVAAFNALHSNIQVNAIYSGSYGQTYDKVLARIDAGDPPAVAVTNVNTMVDLHEMDAIIPLNEYVVEENGFVFMDNYYFPMFESEILELNPDAGGHLFDGSDTVKLMGWPMMRSTPVLYINEDMLKEFGVDPPRNWYELIDAAKAMTTDTKKGLGIPGSWSDWIYGAFSREGGTQVIESKTWDTVTFDSSGNTNALSIWQRLAEDGSIPVPLTPWGEAIGSFLQGEFPMLYFTTGGISKIKAGANFTWDAIYCPAGTHGYGVTMGGGDFHIFNNVPKAQQDAAWDLIKFLTSPENAAQWSVASGYIAVNKNSYDTELMQAALKETPQYVVARNQLSYAYPQMMSENINEVRQVLNDNLDALVAGNKTIAAVQADGQAGMVEAIGGVPDASGVPAPSGDAVTPPSSATATSVCVGLLLVLGISVTFA